MTTQSGTPVTTGTDEHVDARRFARIEDALEAMRQGRPVLVLDDEDRENEGDVVAAGQTLTDEWMAWMIRHGSGYVCAPMPDEWADHLDLPPMVARNEDTRRTAYTVTCDARDGVTTGISAADRAHTVRLLADPSIDAGDLVRPGHMVPLRARPGGVLERRGHTEATVDLCRLAGLEPVGAIAELVHHDGTMMRAPAVLALGAETGLPVVTIEQLAAYRSRHDRVLRTAATRLPTDDGLFTLIGYRDLLTGAEHVALVSPRGLHGDLASAPEGVTTPRDDTSPQGRVLARVHSECLTGDAFGSRRCDCGPQFRAARRIVADEGGLLVYLRGHEGRGVGLLAKLAAYELQDEGADTVEAQTRLGLPVDAREYGAAAAILADLGVESVDLLTNNPAKREGLLAAGFGDVGTRPLHADVNADNVRYLRTKAERMRHTFAETDLHVPGED
ncbi:3,4-dihydroxy-2-butanone-4-phosphate synthase [Mobilicoccus pelagius]|uniref:Multifunctional fusion protein n=1 Tax=Mobilicoccus pelagius NBRC 104925 TaxID=1089455 RepID=H5UUZ3_9MICO|nr:3,4-dihydroxy-2-butanone-4-phosphate synthase [Mobilicoccus pelagius]GAB49551.1 GTP cyclohydrolase II [Mobilicoccus pelagius NBRC 104925]